MCLHRFLNKLHANLSHGCNEKDLAVQTCRRACTHIWPPAAMCSPAFVPQYCLSGPLIVRSLSLCAVNLVSSPILFVTKPQFALAQLISTSERVFVPTPLQDARKDLKDLATDEDKTFGKDASSRSRKRARSSQELSAQKPRKLEFSAKKSGASHGATDSAGQRSSDEGSSDDGGSDGEDLDIFNGKYAAGRGSAEKSSKALGASAAGEGVKEEPLPSDVEPEAPDDDVPGSGAEEPDEEMEPFSAVPVSVRKQIKSFEPKLLDALPPNLRKHSWLHYSVLRCLRLQM